MRKKIKAIGYIRVSTEHQVDGYSLDNQRNDIEQECLKNDWELVDILSDEGISGASLDKRYGIQEALYRISSENIDYLVVWKISRLSRTVTDVVKITERLTKNDAFLYSVKDRIDTSTGMGKTFLYISTIFAEMERDSIITQVKGGMAQKARAGEWNGGFAPLGYKLENKKLIIDEDGAKIVKEIFSLYLKGNGYKFIAETLNAKDLKTSKNKPFSINSVKLILKNITYAGKIRWNYLKDWGKKDEEGKRKRRINENYEIHDGVHEAIVSLEDFEHVQYLIENNPRRNMKQFGKKADNILSGILRCPDCSQGMSVQPTSKGYSYYICNQYANKGKDACNINSVRLDKIEKEFFEIFDKIVCSDDFIKRMNKGINTNSQGIKELEKQIKNVSDVIISLKDKETKLIDEYIDEQPGRLKDRLKDRFEEVGLEIQDKEKTLSNLKLRKKKLELNTVNVSEVSMILKNAGLLLKEMPRQAQRDLLRNLIESITTENGSIRLIHFKFDESIDIKNVEEIKFAGKQLPQNLSPKDFGVRCSTVHS